MSVIMMRFKCLPKAEKRWLVYETQPGPKVAKRRIVPIMMSLFQVAMVEMHTQVFSIQEHIALPAVAAVRLVCRPMAVTVAMAHPIPKGMVVRLVLETRPPEMAAMVWPQRLLAVTGEVTLAKLAKITVVAAVAAYPMRLPTNQVLPAPRDMCVSPI